MSENSTDLPVLEQPPSGKTEVKWYVEPNGRVKHEILNLWPSPEGETSRDFGFGVTKARMIIDQGEDIIWFVDAFGTTDLDSTENLAQPPSKKSQVTAIAKRGTIHPILCLNPTARPGRFQFGLDKARTVLDSLDDISWFIEKYGKPMIKQEITRRGAAPAPAALSKERQEELLRRVAEARARVAASKSDGLVT